MNNLETRRRRAIYRGIHRGTKEMDFVVGKFASQTVPEMNNTELTIFEKFLDQPDREIEAWIMQGESDYTIEFKELIQKIRMFHNLNQE